MSSLSWAEEIASLAACRNRGFLSTRAGAPFNKLSKIMPTILVTVYDTPHPNRGLSPLYTLHVEIHPDAADAKKCWVVMEKFGRRQGSEARQHSEPRNEKQRALPG